MFHLYSRLTNFWHSLFRGATQIRLDTKYGSKSYYLQYSEVP